VTKAAIFSLERTDGAFRAGRLTLPHGMVETPTFMPVGTQGSVKAVSQDDLLAAGAHIILSNTYHLYLRPGDELIARRGGLNGFTSWDRPFLTDSGGYQVFSLGDRNKITEDGVEFKSHIDGSSHMFTPEKAMEIEGNLGADIVMAFDECTPYPASREYAQESMDRTTRWAKRSMVRHQTLLAENPARNQSLFGIVQGGTYSDLRVEHAQALVEMEFPGYALGGLSVGEPKDEMAQMLDVVVPELPVDKPRYLMGVGYPEDILSGFARGIDMFDCVIPTRNGRKGMVFTRSGPINLRNLVFSEADEPIEEECRCEACMKYSRSYVRHLVRVEEILGLRLCTLHNLTFYLDMMRQLRNAVLKGEAGTWSKDFLEKYHSGRKEQPVR